MVNHGTEGSGWKLAGFQELREVLGGRCAEAVGKMPEHVWACVSCTRSSRLSCKAGGPTRFTKGVRRSDLSSRRLFWPNGEWNRDRHDQTRFKQKASWPRPWQHYSQLPKGRKNPHVRQLTNREMKRDSHPHDRTLLRRQKGVAWGYMLPCG